MYVDIVEEFLVYSLAVFGAIDEVIPGIVSG